MAVASRSFSNHAVLRAELLAAFPRSIFNEAGVSLVGSDLISFLGQADYAVVGLERVDAQLLDQLPRLRGVAKFGVGIDTIDLAALSERSIKFEVTPGTNAIAVAELAILLILASRRRLMDSIRVVAAGEWRQTKGHELSGSTVGVVGFGHVGRQLSAMLAGFECRILGFDAFPGEPVRGVSFVPLDQLLSEADIVSIHLPLTDSTRSFIGENELSRMRPGAILINTSRGGIVDEEALITALSDGTIGGAALDVLATEPHVNDSLFQVPNLLLTPHIGGSTEESIVRMGRAAIACLSRLAGRIPE